MRLLTEQQKCQFGLSRQHLRQINQADRLFLLDARVVEPWQKLQQAASQQGFDLQLVSSYRGFDRQLAIWQAKASGQRDLLDDNGVLLDYSQLSPLQCMQAIMRWSAVPGLSRHHWGTDIDVFDANAMTIQDVQLTPEEVEGHGACAPLHNWLDECIANNASFGFYRPYHRDAGGVAPERWHLSYLPISEQFMHKPPAASLLALWQEYDVAFLHELEKDYDAIFNRYVALSLQDQPEWVKTLLRA